MGDIETLDELTNASEEALNALAIEMSEEEIQIFCSGLDAGKKMGTGYYVKNIISLGAQGRIQAALKEHDQHLRELAEADLLMRKDRNSVENALKELALKKIRCAEKLKLISKLSKNIGAKQRSVSGEHAPVTMPELDMKRIDSTITAGEMAWSAVRGASGGLGVAATTWALVGTFGTASTGTAISTLGGAALTNATLAWLGGGSVAAGGAGMAGGAVVLGGVAAVPAILLYVGWSHLKASQKIREIEESNVAVIAHIDSRKSMQIVLGTLQARAMEICDALDRSEKVFIEVYRRAYWKLFPFGPFSQLRRYISSKLFGTPFFLLEEVEVIRQVIIVAGQFARIIDQPLIDKEGVTLTSKVEQLKPNGGEATDE